MPEQLQHHVRTVNVCIPCRNRKKRCDKKFPVCTYCSTRDLLCSYDTNGQIHSNDRPLSLTKSIAKHNQANGVRTKVSDASGDIDFRTRVLSALASTGRTAVQIRDDFFSGTFLWLPIAAPWRLSSNRINLEAAATTDTLVLLLVLSLLGNTMSAPESEKSAQVAASHYLEVKRLYAEAQIYAGVTPAILQAGLLLAVYETVTRRLQLAYLTVQAAVNMQHLLFDYREMHQRHAAPLDLAYAEKRNMICGLSIVQMIVSVEAAELLQVGLGERIYGAQVDLPHVDLWAEIDPILLTATTFEPPVKAAVECFQGLGFRRLYEACLWLGKTMSCLAVVMPLSQTLESLDALDEGVRIFLTNAMSEYSRVGHHCGATCMAIRTLLLLHETVLALLEDGDMPGELLIQQKPKSQVGFTAATRMMANVAKRHLVDCDHVDMLPITATYSMRKSLTHLEELSFARGTVDQTDLEALKAMLRAFHRQWRYNDGDL